MSKCNVCGKEMTVKTDEHGKEYAVQMCSKECMGTAWNIVTDALKRGVRPRWYEEKTGKTFRLTDADRVEILELYEQGMEISDIAAITGRSYATVRNVINNYDLVYEE